MRNVTVRIHAFGVRTRAAGRNFAITSSARTARIYRPDIEPGIAQSPAFFRCAHDPGTVPAPGHRIARDARPPQLAAAAAIPTI
ncbi:hypothetical protein GGTG_00239 [Gaeumannomyces tritici R3-111a-1]|uniref:Uncharacterized protein n=1 Tax=Gaeumannomyces tritici (strain R3-111a-1) TaxID=644352 RepID=J3NG46_GAET3|nr:hypothetical protein GGTG_00239 [Gaeumannomyces tritici R3-111a-1]EJT80236.1 hypothetical protein GGTG_00239 [Gaeumannomyces tritici R3-111a-1]